ncbi:hypothetical protein Lalb_Chr11g0072041 [Lupinus albus]|uniref:Uncharacterized protein n=1 Tax=Lupinus albus TaxID=3870 RepID=A0A6A4PSD7_LUPAL|nr:hypothetical protein Lalb_Chr11g0072041 [Lupinus albus]
MSPFTFLICTIIHHILLSYESCRNGSSLQSKAPIRRLNFVLFWTEGSSYFFTFSILCLHLYKLKHLKFVMVSD